MNKHYFEDKDLSKAAMLIDSGYVDSNTSLFKLAAVLYAKRIKQKDTNNAKTE